ncbi:MAG: RNA polymerase sigma factor [Aggregatilineales bacterium]
MPPLSKQPEIIAIIERCLQGDQSGYAELYAQYSAGLYRLCYSLLLHQQDAEDVLQDAFVYAFKNLQRYDSDRASFKTWLYTIAVSRCRNMYRRKRFPTIDLTQMVHFEPAAPRSDTPEAAIARRDAEEAIQKALQSLSPRLREAVVLRYGHGLTYREMAGIMDCPQKTAESRVRLAHKKLHSVLEPVGHGLLSELLRI